MSSAGKKSLASRPSSSKLRSQQVTRRTSTTHLDPAPTLDLQETPPTTKRNLKEKKFMRKSSMTSLRRTFQILSKVVTD